MSEPITPLSQLAARTQGVDYNRTSQLEMPGPKSKESIREAKLRKATQDFESLFIYKLLKSMRATVPKITESKFGMETMREITDEQLAVYLAHQGGVGLGEMLYRSLQQRESKAGPQDNHAPSATVEPTARTASPESKPDFQIPDRLTPIEMPVPQTNHRHQTKSSDADQ